MKKALYLITVLVLALSLSLLTSCGDDSTTTIDNSDTTIGGGSDDTTTGGGSDDTTVTPPVSTEVEITGVTFENMSATYDGTLKTLSASNIPSGVTAQYSGNTGTNAGTYNATVTLSGEGFITKTLNATLTINKATLENITVEENKKVTVDGEFHLPEITGVLPNGVSVKWYFNDSLKNDGVKELGTYNVRVVIGGDNYADLTLTTTFTIKENLLALAGQVIDSFGNVPDAWNFIPEAFMVENYVIEEDDIPTYTDFTNVSSIPTKYIGKQLNVVLGVLSKCDKALDYANTVYGALNIIESAYQTFLNSDPDNYRTFSGTAGGFSYTITLDNKMSYLSASIGPVNVTIFSDGENQTYGARVQLTNTTVLKYTVSEDSFVIALNVLDSASTQIEFVRDDDVTMGYVYEYLTVAGHEIVGTSALLCIDEDYVTVVGTKGDFIPTSDSINCEVYNATTGVLVGTEVKETLGEGKKTYDTLWYNLRDITGITSIKKEDKMNGVNPDTIYINGNSDSIHTKLVALIDTSRRFDIEFKKVEAYTYDSVNDEYTKIEFEVPMMFIQEKCLNTFEEDYEDKNDVTVSINASDADEAAVHTGYYVLVEAYKLIRSAVTQQAIIDYCNVGFTLAD